MAYEDEEVSEVLLTEEGAEEQPQYVEEQEEFEFDTAEPEVEEAASGDELNPDSPSFDPYKAYKRMHGEFTRARQELAELKRSVKPEEVEELRRKAQQFDALATPQGRRALRSLIMPDDEQQQASQPAFMSIPNDPLDSIVPSEHVTDESINVFKRIVVDTNRERLGPYVNVVTQLQREMAEIKNFLTTLGQHQQQLQVKNLAKSIGDDVDDQVIGKVGELIQLGLTPEQAYYALRGDKLVGTRKAKADESRQRAVLASPQIAGNSKPLPRKKRDLLEIMEDSFREAGYSPRV